MRHVEPSVRLIARTTLHDRLGIAEAEDWLEAVGVSRDTRQELTDKFEDPGASLIRLCGKRCYMSFEVGMNPNVQKVRDDLGEFIDNILKTGHGSVLEHAYYSFALENVSRVFTAEMNRHRAGMAISEGSMRYIRLEDIPFWVPDSIALTEQERAEAENGNHYAREDEASKLIQKKFATQELFDKAFRQDEENYQAFLGIWQEELAPGSTFKLKKQLTSVGRRIIGIGVATGGVWTGNIRALRHIFTMRCDESAEEEICLVASKMLELMMQAEPLLFKDFEKVDGYWKPKYRKV